MSTRLIAALATCALLASAPVVADPGHGRGFYRQSPKHVVVKQKVVYRAPRVAYHRAPRVVYARPAYYPAPVYAPAPMYVGGYGHYGHHGHHGNDDAWKWVAGGALVGAILYGIDH